MLSEKNDILEPAILTEVLLEKTASVTNVIETAKEEANKIIETAKEEVNKLVEITKKEVNKLVETAKEEANKILETTKKDAIKNANEKVVPKTLSNLFVDFIAKDNDSKIVLSKESFDIVKKIISVSPNFLDDVEKSLLEIIKDGKIDSNDLPHLIILIQKFYETIYRVTDAKLVITIACSEVLKMVVYFLIKELRIKFEEEKTDLFLEQFNTLIDSCIELLSFSKSIKVKGCFSSLLCK